MFSTPRSTPEDIHDAVFRAWTSTSQLTISRITGVNAQLLPEAAEDVTCVIGCASHVDFNQILLYPALSKIPPSSMFSNLPNFSKRRPVKKLKGQRGSGRADDDTGATNQWGNGNGSRSRGRCRSFDKLQRLYDIRQRRAISDADGEGYLYAYVDSNEVKMGMTKNFNRRKEEWDKNCPHAGRIWFPPVRVDNRRRAESLAHLLLEMECVDRPHVYCQNLWITIVYPILLRAAVA
ncbi:hypothetical protein F5051DRAFT_429410 [Lentinula edodes]|nr:hypothetical protein F5051DRAFT_429410 [Lentinula edodes]